MVRYHDYKTSFNIKYNVYYIHMEKTNFQKKFTCFESAYILCILKIQFKLEKYSCHQSHKYTSFQI